MGPQVDWGIAAAAGYLAAAVAAALLPRARAVRASIALALLGALLVPLLANLVTGACQPEVTVPQQAATQFLHTGSPYLAHPPRLDDYDPYLPGMVLFGLPRALLGTHWTVLRILGDTRIWFLAAFVGCLAGSWRLLRPGDGDRRSWLWPCAAVTASPLLSLAACTGGVDLPLIGCCLLGLTLAGTGHPVRAGLLLALACALKWTAWPALPVAVLLLQQAYGRRAALRCAVVTVAGAAALILPVALLTPAAMLDQVVRFPLGLTAVRTPADSPLPGHLLAGLGPVGRGADVALLVLGALGVALWLWLSPPGTARQAADRLAVGVSIAFLLAPAGRFGYLQLPALLLLWPRLAERVPGRGPSVAGGEYFPGKVMLTPVPSTPRGAPHGSPPS